MSRYYYLDGHSVLPTDDISKCFAKHVDRVVAKTQIGEVGISTVFLGIDHRYDGGGPPLLFETMIFGGEHDKYQERYSSWDEAEAGHKKVVELVRGNHGSA